MPILINDKQLKFPDAPDTRGQPPMTVKTAKPIQLRQPITFDTNPDMSDKGGDDTSPTNRCTVF